ncbi:MAG: urease accessory UreF family protein [Verrucomicrobiales bacterium]|nr:urease accessory UreF family protein [Verrucomicrobiales bacterium]
MATTHPQPESDGIEDPLNDFAWIAPLLHLSDSALPVGAYAHSAGLEGVVQMGMVRDAESLGRFLMRDVAHSLRQIDLPLVAKAHAAALDAREDELARLDRLSWALRPSRQIREATSTIGRQQLRVYGETWSEEKLLTLPHFQAPVVIGMIAAYSDIPVRGALLSLAYQTYSGLVQASLKLLPVGPQATQKLLHEALAGILPHLNDCLNRSDDELGSFNPVWDIAASRHERAPARMFLS